MPKERERSAQAKPASRSFASSFHTPLSCGPHRGRATILTSKFERAFELWNVIGADDELDGAGLAGDALDEAALFQADELAAEGYESVLKNSRYCFLKRRPNLTIRQATRDKRQLIKIS
jgi:hypothetical protein